MELKNKHLLNIEVDHFHHLGFATDSCNVKAKYGDVKLVCICGSMNRVKGLVKFLNDELKLLKDEDVVNLCTTDRYVMYKLGPVLVASHGMGVPSVSILLNELLKLLSYAEAKDPIFLRIGTCGGLGVEPGTVVITDRAVNAYLKPTFQQVVLGKLREYDARMDAGVGNGLLHASKQMIGFDVIKGDTMCCDDFYEGQARLDGAFCDYTEEDKMRYVQLLHENGVRNIEMECTVIGSMCNRAHARGAVMCVVLVNRLRSDQVIMTPETYAEYQERPWKILLSFLKELLSQD